MKTFNQKLAETITRFVGTMWCAYLFAIIACISLPSALHTQDPIVIVGWIAQTFLQLVLLSIIMVGQSVQSAALTKKINETHEASLGEFALAKEARHLARKELVELKQLASDVRALVQKLETNTR